MKITYEKATAIIDFLVAFVALIMMLPIFVPIIIILKLTGENQVFYLQQRIGFGGKKFYLIKFATMLKDSPTIGSGGITLRNDPRVLPVGRVLRKTKINELPQVLNILKGDMSVVGPRPLMEKQFNFYSQKQKECISLMRPGLTGAASIIFRDEEKFFDGKDNPDEIYRLVIAPAKGILEEWYYRNRTIKLYFKIIINTFLALIFPANNYYDFLDDNIKRELDHVLSKYR